MGYIIQAENGGAFQAIAASSSTPLHKLGSVVRAIDPSFGGAEFIYLKTGVANLVNSLVYYDSTSYAATSVAPTAGGAAVGRSAIAMAANSANGYGWYQISGMNINNAILNSTPRLISQSYAAVSRSSNNSTDNTYFTLATVTVPGGTMNYSGKIVIEQDWAYTNSVNTKNLRIDWGGTWMTAVPATSTNRAWLALAVKNANSLASQTALNSSAFGLGAEITTAVDTTQDVAVDFRCNWGANVVGEQIILRGYSVWYYPGNT